MKKLFEDYPGGQEFSTYVETCILADEREKGPKTCSQILKECQLIREMAKELIEEPYFKK